MEEKIFKNTKNKISLIKIILLCLLTISIATIITIAFYNHPAADDYNFGIYGAHAWRETGSLIEVIKATIRQVVNFYETWQGTFSAVFIMALQPTIFGENLYWIGTVIIILALVSSNIYLAKSILKEYFTVDKSIIFIIISTILVYCIQFVPTPVETFFWYNGSIYYTFFYSLMLFLIGFMLRMIKTEKKRKIIEYSILIPIISFIIGGGNYVTALIATIMIVLFNIFAFLYKKQNKKILVIALVSIVLSFTISMTAPGNAVRQSTCDGSLTAIKAIIKSLVLGVQYITEWTTLPVMLGIVFLIPFFYYIITHSKVEYKYKYPLLVTIFTFGIFSAQFTPPLYAMNNIGGARLLDIIYYSYYWLIMINIFYYIGWFNRKVKESTKDYSRINDNIINIGKKYILTYSAVIFIAIMIINVVNCNNGNQITSIIAINEIRSGEVQQYDLEMKERIKLYLDENKQEIVLNELTVKPYLIYFDDITEDNNNWLNVALREYYKKDSIVLMPYNE